MNAVAHDTDLMRAVRAPHTTVATSASHCNGFHKSCSRLCRLRVYPKHSTGTVSYTHLTLPTILLV